ncbi:MAG: inorganic diphosphatase, partial [Actinomycetes bacterium]
MEVEMIVEIPQGSRNKYEMNHDTGEIKFFALIQIA